MSLLASDVMARSALFLNDINQVLFTNTALLPFLKEANDELQDELTNIDSSFQRQIASPDVTITAGTKTYTTLPSDFWLPISLKEKTPGAPDSDFVDMMEERFEPAEIQTNYLRSWTFRNEGIYFIGATSDRIVRLYYDRTIAQITGNNSPIEATQVMRFLSARTAELAASMMGDNPEVAGEIQSRRSEKALDDLRRVLVRNSQGIRSRRKPFHSRTVRSL